MDTMYQAPFQASFKDESLWSASSAIQQPCWPPTDILAASGTGMQFSLQQQNFLTVESHFMHGFTSSCTPGASPLLSSDSSPFLPTLYPIKPDQIVSERSSTSNSDRDEGFAPFPTPDPSPHLSPSPQMSLVSDQPGSINALMKEIQSRSKDIESSPETADCTAHISATGSSQERSFMKGKKHVCPREDCGKTFSQKTHLDIHLRSHSGLKPFACPYPPCPSRFTQLGNLKTHIRRHTGEKPFACDLCNKRFAQRGNVRSHRATVHASREDKRMFECKLDGCGKFFSQRGNLKGHMERFHSEAINELTLRFSGIRDPDDIVRQLSPQEQQLWEYLREMYRHSNKGIKGRGKDRKIMVVTGQSPSGSEQSSTDSSTPSFVMSTS